MDSDEQPDSILRLLADLPPMTPSAACDRRVLVRCHAALHTTSHRRGASAIDMTMAAAIAGYAVAAAREVIRLLY